ncbi:L-threo-3-deoxy-hexylosonate aldolase [Sphaceloma murrayae]|uniref:L-threo-3-deoxy-hexylosonate aldolase n=1 Tax=Sphaceloma murrayae TaxID=2082308 RepID=A0A2K1R3M5_9PEZI|nr:L-threo-3-deoxy-hexylosonate aldolase [Sphaceloma murrayae]
MPHAPPPGVYAPAITLFNPDDTLDLASQSLYYAHLSRTGLAGLVILGTNAETFLLTRDERARLLQTARQAVGPSFPLIAGVSGHSTAQVLEFISDAHAAGSDYALLLPPAYFRAATTPAVIESFYLDIAARSPLPIVLYNFPGVCNGVDLDSTTIESLADKSENIVGVKLTCGSVGKVTRLAARFSPDRFAVFGGQSDFLVGTLASGGAGCIAAFANVAPRSVVRVYEAYVQGGEEGRKEALKTHQLAARAEAAVKGGIATVKYGASLQTFVGAGIGGDLTGAEREKFVAERTKARKPYGGVEGPAAEKIKQGLAEVIQLEKQLEDDAGQKTNGAKMMT